MFRSAHTGAFLILLASLISGAVAQESSEFHQFTDKKGQRISAVLLNVSPDRQQMKIRREDGQEFETVINLLSLDDQQYIKDWLKESPPTESVDAATVDFRLDVLLSRQTASVEKHISGNVTLEARSTTFRIAVRNLSRDSLEGARLAYAVVWEDRAALYQRPDGEWAFRATSGADGTSHRVKQAGEIALESLRFNAESAIETIPVTMDQVLFFGTNKPYHQDEMIGAKVRILSKDGLVLQESDSGGAAIAEVKWEDIESLPAPMGAN